MCMLSKCDQIHKDVKSPCHSGPLWSAWFCCDRSSIWRNEIKMRWKRWFKLDDPNITEPAIWEISKILVQRLYNVWCSIGAVRIHVPNGRPQLMLEFLWSDPRKCPTDSADEFPVVVFAVGRFQMALDLILTVVILPFFLEWLCKRLPEGPHPCFFLFSFRVYRIFVRQGRGWDLECYGAKLKRRSLRTTTVALDFWFSGGCSWMAPDFSQRFR